MIRLIYFLILIGLFFSCNQDKKDKTKIQYDYEELIQKSPEELRIIRNEIFARHGYKFKSPDLRNYFKSKDWYEPKYDNVDSLLTELDRQNIQVILKAEKYVNRQVKINNYFAQRVDTAIGKINLPIETNSVIKSFGKPDSSYIDQDEFCAIGQLHFWTFKDQNFQFMVLGDKYGKPLDYSAKSRLVIVRLIEKGKPSGFPGFLGIKLGDSENTVREQISKFLVKHNNYRLETFDYKTVVDRFLIDKIKNVYWITNENMFFHFVINPDGKLEHIIQCNFNIRAVC